MADEKKIEFKKVMYKDIPCFEIPLRAKRMKGTTKAGKAYDFYLYTFKDEINKKLITVKFKQEVVNVPKADCVVIVSRAVKENSNGKKTYAYINKTKDEFNDDDIIWIRQVLESRELNSELIMPTDDMSDDLPF